MVHRESNFELPIRFNYHPPSLWLHFLTLIHTAAIISFFQVAVPVWFRSFICLAVIISYFYYYFIYHCAKKNTVLFSLNALNEWNIKGPANMDEPIYLLPGTFVHPDLIIMRFKKTSGKQVNIFLTRENSNPATHRRLRVRLRFPNVHRSGH